MTISIGQYIPGNSFLHRADPRTKLVLTLVYMIFTVLIHHFIGYAVAAALLLAAIICASVPPRIIIKSMKPVVFIVIFTMILNLFFYKGEHVLFHIWKINIYYESIIFSVKMMIRIMLLVVGASLLTYTTTSVMLTDGLESLMSPLRVIGFPAHEVAMMMSIALRFIPTFVEETERIMKAQAARGSDFDSKKLREKVKSFIPILIPLFVGAFRRAEEMATAMNARCYRGGKGRTKFRVLKFTYVDAVLAMITLVFCAAIVFLEFFM